jgi:hypothetical protein
MSPPPPNTVPMERYVPSPETMIYSFSHSFKSLKSPHLRSPPTKWGENTFTIHRTPRGGRPIYNGVGPDSEEDRLKYCYYYLIAMQPSAR